MKKDDFIRQVERCGDAIITYRSQNSRRLKYNVCTLDFDNKYIQSKRNRAKPNANQVATRDARHPPLDALPTPQVLVRTSACELGLASP